jgi:hypothetical protein
MKELTLNPSFRKRRTFFPILFVREGGMRVELFNLYIAKLPQNLVGNCKILIELKGMKNLF